GFLLPKYATGYYGALTTTAVQAFQKKYGIVTTGTPGTTGFGSVGAKTRTKINTFITPTSSVSVSVTTPKTTPPATTPTPPTTVSSSIFTRSLKLGDTGADVKALQIFLNNHGFLVAQSGPESKGQETSTFDTNVKAALIRFQNANASQVLTPYGLSEGTGYFDSGTMKVVKLMAE
ncbi:MAG: peptidoglycan-binding domain-containing protein, partial [bacterium]